MGLEVIEEISEVRGGQIPGGATTKIEGGSGAGPTVCSQQVGGDGYIARDEGRVVRAEVAMTPVDKEGTKRTAVSTERYVSVEAEGSSSARQKGEPRDFLKCESRV